MPQQNETPNLENWYNEPTNIGQNTQNQNQKQSILTDEQTTLVTELTETYGIEPEEIIFFQNDRKPFLSYEANCALVNKLTGVQDITIEPMEAVMVDSFALRCTLLTGEGFTRSAVGVANIKETINGVKMSEQQIYSLASARAIRNALKTAGLDLLKLHQQVKSGANDLDFKPKSNYATLLGQAHILGAEKRLIVGDNKTLWYHELWSRYRVQRSNDLSEPQLADYVAYLNAYEPPRAIGA